MDQIGAGVGEAFLRQGLKELSQIIPAFPESVRVVEEPGTLGNPTQQIVTEQMQPSATPEPQPAIEPEMG